jgi:hypothetical protein
LKFKRASKCYEEIKATESSRSSLSLSPFHPWWHFPWPFFPNAAISLTKRIHLFA